MGSDDNQERWWVCEDIDFIGSEISDDSQVGFLEFTDGVLLVCGVPEELLTDLDSIGTSRSSEEAENLLFCEPVDLDDIPF